MESRKITEPWHLFLLDIDQKLYEAIELECLGGFIITQIYQLARPTADVDIITVNPQINQICCAS